MWNVAEHNLANARLLATIDPGSPRQGSLRRAVSTVYHAVFQSLCEICADGLVGWKRSWEAFTSIFRSVEHARTATVLKDRSFASTAILARLALRFRELQMAREWADYSPESRPDYDPNENEKPFSREEALSLVIIAEECFEILGNLDDAKRLKLATRLVTKPRK